MTDDLKIEIKKLINRCRKDAEAYKEIKKDPDNFSNGAFTTYVYIAQDLEDLLHSGKPLEKGLQKLCKQYWEESDEWESESKNYDTFSNGAFSVYVWVADELEKLAGNSMKGHTNKAPSKMFGNLKGLENSMRKIL